MAEWAAGPFAGQLAAGRETPQDERDARDSMESSFVWQVARNQRRVRTAKSRD